MGEDAKNGVSMKMSEVLKLPFVATNTKSQSTELSGNIWSGNGNDGLVSDSVTPEEAEAICLAVNTHDSMVDRIAELEKNVKSEHVLAAYVNLRLKEAEGLLDNATLLIKKVATAKQGDEITFGDFGNAIVLNRDINTFLAEGHKENEAKF